MIESSTVINKRNDASYSSFLNRPGTIVIILCAWLLMNLPGLLTYPSVTSDEGRFSNVAWRFVQHGDLRQTMVGPLGSERNTGLFQGRLYTVLLGLDFRMFGPGLRQARAASLLGGAVAGVLIWKVAGELGLGAAPALAAALLFLFSWKTFLASHRARPDIFMAVGALLMLYLYLRARVAPTARRHFILGFVCAYLIDIHVPLCVSTAAIGLMVGLDRLRGHLRWKPLLSFGLGATLGLGAWLALWLLPDSVALASDQMGQTGPGVMARSLSGWSVLGQFNHFTSWLWLVFGQETRLSLLESFIILAGLVVLLVHRNETNRLLLTLLGFTALALFAVPDVQSYHAVMVIPFISLIVARGAETIGRIAVPSRLRRFITPDWATILCIGPLMAAYVVGDVTLTWRSRTISYSGYAAALRSMIPPGRNVLGEAVWWFEFNDGLFTADTYILNWGGADRYTEPNPWLTQVLRDRQVEYVLLDERFGSWWQDSRSLEQAALHDAFQTRLHTDCEYVGVVEKPYYGVELGGPGLKRTTVWRCRADPPE